MKTITRILLLTAAIFTGYTASAQKISEKQNYFGVFLNPGGFALMGPTAGVEYTLHNKYIFEASFRMPSLGAIMTTVTDFDDRAAETSMEGGYGIGIAAKYFIPKSKGGWYFGVFAEYTYMQYRYHYFTDGWSNRVVRYPEMGGVGFGGTAGYKYFFKNGLYLRGGLYLGGLALGQTTYYDSDDSIVEEEPGSFWPYANLDISIGFRF